MCPVSHLVRQFRFQICTEAHMLGRVCLAWCVSGIGMLAVVSAAP